VATISKPLTFAEFERLPESGMRRELRHGEIIETPPPVHRHYALVIEVLSPSNSATEIREKRRLCLENGSREFWVVDPIQREIEVSTTDGRSIIYRSGQGIPLFFAEGSVAVDEVFE
jgi:Uma2 family endonuclease